MRFSFVAVFIFYTSVVFAQKSFRSGYIVTLQGDTIAGLIDYKEWNKAPVSISFKTAGENATETKYGVNDINFFSITGIEAHRRAVVSISLHSATLNDLNGRDTSWKIDTVFLKVISSGQTASLLSYTDRIKERFYILEDGRDEPVELITRDYLSANRQSLIQEKPYKNQLKGLFHSKGTFTAAIGDKIDKADYEECDLKNIMALLNRADNEELPEVKENRKASWFAGIGLQRDNISFLGNHQLAKLPNSGNSAVLPVISAGVDLFANPVVGKLFYRLEAGYQVNRSTFTANHPENVKIVYSLAGSTIFLRAQVNYAIYNTPKFKIPIGIGFLHNQMSYSKNQYKKVYTNGDENNHVENWLDLRKSVTTLFARGSMVFNRKIEVSLMYRPSSSLTKTKAYSMGTSNMQLQVYYLFGRKA